MANIDECDLETLSALLQDSDDDTDNSNYTTAANTSMGKLGDQDVISSRLVTEFAKTEDSKERGDSSSGDTWAVGNQTHPDLTKKLQEELVTMQQRMLEIQKMLSSPQPLTFTATPSSSSSKPCFSSDQSIPRPASYSHKNNETRKFSSVKDPVEKARWASSEIVEASSTVSKCVSTSYSLNRGVDCHSSQISGLSQQEKTCRSEEDNGINTIRQDCSANSTSGNQDQAFGCQQSMKKNLFGDDDSDSDWEDMDGGKPDLSKAGQEIKALLKRGEKQRVAHTPSYSPSKVSKLTSLPSWKKQLSWRSESEKSLGLQGEHQTAVGLHQSADKVSSQEPFITDKFSNIRIVNPLISCAMLASKMEGRRMIHLSQLHLKLKAPELQGDWVTMGIIVHKSDAHKSSNGKTFCIWKLSDLNDDSRTTSFFLFGQVYKQLWKTSIGAVLGILNPSIMDTLEKNGGEVSFTVNSAAQMMVMGQSKDLGWCIGRTKNGNKCSKFINKKYGEYCSYHIQAAYRKTSAKRSELQGSCPGVTPKSFQKKVFCGGPSTVIYGGQSFSMQRSTNTKAKDKVTLAKLHAHSISDGRRVTTMSIQDLSPLAQSNVTQKLLKEHDVPFLDMLATPTQGSMNLVRHIMTCEGLDSGKAAGNKHSSFQSVTAASLIKQHKQEMQEKIHQRRSQTKCGLQAAGKNDLKPSPDKDSGNNTQSNDRQLKGNRSANNSQSTNAPLGKKSRIDHTKSDGGQNGVEVKHVSDYSRQESQNDASQHLQLQVCTKASGNKPAQSVSENKRERDKVHSSHLVKTFPSFSTTDTKEAPLHNQPHGGLPMIGKGFAPGQDISICFEKPSSLLLASSTSAAKLKAIETIRSSGGIDKVDPNSTKKKPSQVKENVRKRLLECTTSDAVETASGSRVEEPKKKKPRLLGGVDLNSEEVQSLLKARSSHKGALAEAEAEREDKYFHELERKEGMEEKMQSITSLEVTVFTCDQCKYTAFAPGEKCKQENHAVRRHKGKKHFFKCKTCSHRTVTLHRYPTLPCSKCGDERFEKTSMWKEKSGPKLDSEVLCLRGDEVKFLDSLHSKVFVNI